MEATRLHELGELIGEYSEYGKGEKNLKGRDPASAGVESLRDTNSNPNSPKPESPHTRSLLEHGLFRRVKKKRPEGILQSLRSEMNDDPKFILRLLK
jgi:hypothetical protein